MLEQAQVLSLLVSAKLGDNLAKEQLLQHNSPLIKSVIRRFKNKGVEYDDLYQLGCIGFLKAITNFDKDFGVKFSTYAVPMIAGEVKRFLRDDGFIKVSRQTKSLSIRIARFVEEYKKAHSDSPKIELIAKQFEIDPQDVVFAMDSGKMPVSIYGDRDEDGMGAIDTLACPQASQSVDRIILKDLISGLSEREQKIVILRFFRDKTQAEVASVLKVSQVQISRLESKIMKKLRKELVVD
ncbi:MAG: sigma-70 family RNA polymerase sigma factor [Firmicutes bacterium]|nr:sigma-70 family RNA polymerase sigma factor [Bacillota bacterium]MCL1953706.1 sigma-70 family RNA polymerase sigma factor [Bacillota bacterium]